MQTHTFSSYGTDYTAEAVVYDSRNDPNHYGHCWWEVDVGYDPTASRNSPSQSSITLTQGQSQTFIASVSDTDCDLNYVEWYLDGVYKDTDTSVSGCSDTSSWTHTFSNTGTYVVKAIVYDDRNSGDHIGYTTWSVTVNPAHDPDADRDSPSSSSIHIAKGASQTFTASVSDTDCDLNYVEWYLGGVHKDTDTSVSGCSDTSSWTHTFSSYETSIEVTAVVFDSRNDPNHYGSCTWYVDVGYDPEASRDSPSQHSVSITQYESQTFTADVSDDDGDLYYVEWYLAGGYQETDTSVSGYTDTSSWSHTFSNTGTYEVKAVVYDTRNDGDYVGYTTWSVTVNPIETIDTINFSDIIWDVRPGSESPQGPGNNYWSNSTENIWVDEEGQLHLNITYRNGKWYCPEIISQESFGYGKYYFFVSSRVDELDKNVVGGLFTYKWRGETTPKEYEIDIEFSRWGVETNENALHVFQYRIADGNPATDDEPNEINPNRFDISLSGEYSTHTFVWKNNYLHFQSYHGHYDDLPSEDYLISEKIWEDPRIPPESGEKVHLNLWLVNGKPPSDGQSAEMIVKEFKFIPPEEPKWTFMVFMNGDNNLEGAAIDDFGEMASAGSTAEVNIVVQMDRIPGFNTSNGDWTGTKRFYVTSGMNPTPANAVQDLGDDPDPNMGDPQTLIDFVDWAKTNYPADHYAVVIWDHGSGWQRRAEEPIQSISDDWTSSDTITMPELRQALATITNSGADKLDIVGFDACLMAMEEVDYQIIPYADYRVGSEETEPEDGWDYAASMTYLVNDPTCTAAQLSTRIVNDYINFYGTSGEETQSAVNLNNLNSLVTATSNLGNDLKNNLPSYRTQIEGVKDTVEHFDSNGDYISDVYDYYVDLHHFATLIKGSISDPTIQNDAQNVMDAITNIVIAEGHGSQHSNSRGISIYFSDPRYNVYMTNYETDVVFSQDTQWDEFLWLYSDITPPTQVTNLHSTSHSTETWSTDNTIDVSWTAAIDDSSGLDGYSIEWSHSSDTLPDESKDIEETVTSRTSPALSTANDWYFHIRSVDNACNWDDTAAHLGPFYIDIDKPSVGLDFPSNNGICGGTIQERIPEPGILIAEAGDLPVTLDWHGSDVGSGLADYKWEYSDDPRFNSYIAPVFSGHVTPPTSEKDLLFSTGRRYWRVNATDNVGYEETSEVWSFIIDGEAPGCYYTDPEAGDHLSDSTPTFSWKFGDSSSGNPGSGLDQYIFKVGTTVDSRGEISDPIISEVFEDPEEDVGYEYTPTSPLSDGSYYWSVTAYDGIGNWHRRWTASPFVIDTTEPILSYSPSSHNFGDKCEGETDSTTFEVWNSGTGTLIYSLSESCGWVEVNPTSGSSTGEHDTITVDVDTTGLSEGSHTCDISIISNGGSGTFTVTVNVMPVAETVVSIEDASAPQGETVTVPVNIADVENMCDANIWLNYEKDVVIVDSVSDGDLVPLTHNIDNTAGVTKMNWDTTSGMTGDFVFAYVTLKAVGNPGDTCLLDLDVNELYDCVPPFNKIPRTVADGTFTVRVNIVPKPDLIITEKWLCWPDNCTICYNVTNIGDGTAPACHNTTLYVDGVGVAHDHVPVDLAHGESYIDHFVGYDWEYTPPSDNITVCADNNDTLDELDENNNCVTNFWMCGDVNEDRTVNVVDVLHVYRRALDPGYPLDLPWAGDVNCDRNINVVDVLHVYRRALDPEYDLNCC